MVLSICGAASLKCCVPVVLGLNKVVPTSMHNQAAQKVVEMTVHWHTCSLDAQSG